MELRGQREEECQHGDAGNVYFHGLGVAAGLDDTELWFTRQEVPARDRLDPIGSTGANKKSANRQGPARAFLERGNGCCFSGFSITRTTCGTPAFAAHRFWAKTDLALPMCLGGPQDPNFLPAS